MANAVMALGRRAQLRPDPPVLDGQLRRGLSMDSELCLTPSCLTPASSAPPLRVCIPLSRRHQSPLSPCTIALGQPDWKAIVKLARSVRQIDELGLHDPVWSSRH